MGRIEDKVIGLAEPIVEGMGLELVEVEYKKEGANWYLRVFIDKEDGVTIEDCQQVSQVLGDELDAQDPVPHSYLLEVSSPGVERPLKRERDYIRFTGRNIFVKTYAPINGRRKIKGLLKETNEGSIVVEDEGGPVVIPLEQVAKANLVPEF